MVLEQVEIVVQINSRNRIKINVSSSLSREELIKVALSDANVIKLLEGKSPKKVIAIPGKLVNLVI